MFIDAKLFPGHRDPKDFFREAVKGALALGFYLESVRADSAYLTKENLLFLKQLSLGLAMGAPATFKEMKFFSILARTPHSCVILWISLKLLRPT